MKRRVASLRLVNPARIAIWYAILGCLWIVVSDAVLAESIQLGLATINGLTFILVTAALLYWFLKRESGASLPLQLAFHHGPFGIAMFDADGRLVSCTPVFTRMFDGDFALFESGEVNHMMESLSLMGAGDVRQLERAIETGVGAKRHVSITFINAGDSPGGFVCFAVDMTRQHELEEDLKRLEAGLRDVQKMEILGQVAGGAAHDFNNHLQILGGYAQLLAEEEDAEAREELFREMERAVNQASALSNKLLTFARRQKSNPVTVDLREICREATSLVTAALPREIVLSIDICDEPLLVEVDRDEMGRVLANLCLNARDAVDGIGKVMVSVSTFVTTGGNDDLAPGAYARVDVADTGCGMEETVIGNLFAPFFTTKGERGTGLGLATSHGIVKQHNGVIKVASFPNRGSTFSVYLPLRDSGDVNLILGDRHDRPTVLLAEKDPEILVLTSRLLSHSGYNVLATRSIDESRALFDEYLDDIGVVVIDLDFLSVRGSDIYDYVRDACRHMPIIFSRGYFMDESRKLPPDVLRINSPSSPDVLKAAIEICLRSATPEVNFVTR